MGTTREIIDEGTEGPINLGPERPRVYSELSQEEKDRCDWFRLYRVAEQRTEVTVARGDWCSWIWESTEQTRNCTQPKRPQNSEYFKDKMLLMQAQENGVTLDEEQSLFLAGGLDNAIDEDVDEQPVQDLALNVDNVFQADDCDAYDLMLMDAPTAVTKPYSWQIINPQIQFYDEEARRI
ncbi:hypothetical protein Tco_0971268 [Tanacetum coccineum]